MTDGLSLAILALVGAYGLAQCLAPFLIRALTGEWPDVGGWRTRKEMERILRETYGPAIEALKNPTEGTTDPKPG